MMKNYERPAVIVAADLAEGVYMLSGDNEVTLQEVFDAYGSDETETEAAETDTAETTTASADTAEASVGGTETDASVEGEITETDTSAESGTDSDTAESVETADTTDASDDTTTDSADAYDSGNMQASSLLVSCNSKYMNGIWQGSTEGSWGDIKLGYQELYGCTGCPADNGDGCGLQNGDGSQYLQMSGSLMPAWEASGKGPDDDPCGI